MKREKQKDNNRFVLVSIFLIIILGFAIYANSLDGQFIWDDVHLVRDNLNIRSPSNILKIFTTNVTPSMRQSFSFYRPLMIFTYALDYYFWKLNVRGYHLTNTILHILAALGLYWLISIIFKDNFLSLLASLLFVAHPIHTEAVTYISGRADPLAAIFIILCCVFYIKQLENRSIGNYVLMIISCLLALFSKENSLILPMLLLIYHYSFKKKFALREFLSIIVITLVFAVVRFTFLKLIVGSIVSETSLLQRAAGFFVAIVSYNRLMVLPFNLHMEYVLRLFAFSVPKVIGGIILLISLLIYAIKARNKNTLMSFSILWFFIALFPVSNLYPINAYMAERWLYLPSIGFFLIVAKALTSLFRIRRFRVVSLMFIISLLSFYSLLTVKQNEYWQEPISFFERTLRYVKNSPRLYYNLGCLYQDTGEHKEAIALYNKAIQINPKHAETYHNLGSVYGDIGKHEEAIVFYKKTLQIDPEYAQAYNNLGIAYNNTGKYEEAIVFSNKALEVDPEYAEAYNNLAVVCNNIGRYEEEIVLYKKALQVNPEYTRAYNNLATAYYNKEEYDLAIQHCDKAIELGHNVNPKLIEALKPFRQ
ncbi:tetratricopeptide repeat protein [Candidatus Omnitrophota bacterium]